MDALVAEKRLLLFVLIASAVMAASTVLAPRGPQMERVVKTTEPFHTLYLRYSDWKHGVLTHGVAGDGRHAREIVLREPMGVAEGPDGSIYLGDRRGFIWQVDRDGISHVIAGTGRRGVTRDGVAALAASLGVPKSIFTGPDGRVYFVDGGNHVAVAVGEDGRLEQVAGTGWPGIVGSEGPAVERPLHEPHDIQFDRNGVLYIADSLNHRVVKVSSSGWMTTVAGTGEKGFSGDGGTALEATLKYPYSIAFDEHNNRIRCTNETGIVQTVAGNGDPASSGDGGPATEASIYDPEAICIRADGTLLMSESPSGRVRAVTPGGEIHTFAGSGPLSADSLSVW
jgi:serine/threonine-protein kinase